MRRRETKRSGFCLVPGYGGWGYYGGGTAKRGAPAADNGRFARSDAVICTSASPLPVVVLFTSSMLTGQKPLLLIDVISCNAVPKPLSV